MVTLEAILDRKNLQRAMEQVARNKGAAGIDGYSAEDVRKWFTDHPYKLTTAGSGSYKAVPNQTGLHTQRQRRKETAGNIYSGRPYRLKVFGSLGGICG